jgi:hypothetical protein
MKKSPVLPALLCLAVCLASIAQSTLSPANPPAVLSFAWNPVASTGPAPLYTIYCGTNSGIYFTNFSAGTNCSMTLSNFARGVTYYFAVADTVGALSSANSTQLSATIEPVPPAPGGFTITVVVP